MFHVFFVQMLLWMTKFRGSVILFAHYHAQCDNTGILFSILSPMENTSNNPLYTKTLCLSAAFPPWFWFVEVPQSIFTFFKAQRILMKPCNLLLPIQITILPLILMEVKAPSFYSLSLDDVAQNSNMSCN